MNNQRRELIKSQVQKLLKAGRIHRPPVRVQFLARNLGIKVRYEPFEREISGVLYRDKESTIIGVNALHHKNRQRFTVAHEIGHYVLHKIDVHVDKGYQFILRDSASSQATDALEIEANQFAAELLMPAHMLRKDVREYLKDLEDESNLQKLAAQYEVSAQAMAFRLANLQLISV